MENRDPIISNKRTGTQDNPYQKITEPLIIDNSGKVQLTEYPNQYNRVVVTGDNKDWYETERDLPNENEFKVDYEQKQVFFHIDNIGKQLSFEYTGMGNSYFPASSIYTERDGLTVVETLDTLTRTTAEVRDYAKEAADIAIEAAGTIDEAVAKADDLAQNTKFVQPYDSSVTYEKNNIVSFGGSSFMAKQFTIGNSPPDPLDATENEYWGLIGRKGADGTGTVKRRKESFIATEGQRVFNLQYTYDQFQDRTSVYVGGVPQGYPDNYEETTDKSITLSEGVPAGTEVIIEYFSESIPLASDIQTAVDNHTAAITSNSNKIGVLTKLATQEKSNLVGAVNENTEQLANTNHNLLNLRSKVPDNFGDLILTEHPRVDNPVLTAADVTDVENVRFIADPDFAYENGTYYMFFEVYVQDGVNDIGHIGLATSKDGEKWIYDRIVLSDGRHFALPTVFKLDDGNWYMLPDRGGRVEGVTLYRATNFPYDWVVDTVLIPNGKHIDPIPFKWGDHWYMHTYTSGVVSFYYADDIKSTNWTLHPMSPIATGSNVRGAGRAIVSEDFILLPMQDGTSGVYGEKIKLHKITNLSPTHFDVHIIEEPILTAGNNKFWNSKGMHTVNFSFSNRNSNPIVAVDGLGGDNNWSIGIYTTGAKTNTIAFRCRRATPLSIPSGAWTKVTWDSVEYDTRKGYDTTNHKYIIPKSGLYMVSMQIGMNASGSSFFGNMRINSNGFEIRSKPHNVSGAEREGRNLISFVMLNKGDEITVDVYQNSGSSKEVMSIGSISWLEITRID